MSEDMDQVEISSKGAGEESDDDDEMDLGNFKVSSSGSVAVKKRKKGIIYISNIPKHMNVTRLKEILGEFGKIGRVYLQPEKVSSKFALQVNIRLLIVSTHLTTQARRLRRKERSTTSTSPRAG